MKVEEEKGEGAAEANRSRFRAVFLRGDRPFFQTGQRMVQVIVSEEKGEDILPGDAGMLYAS